MHVVLVLVLVVAVQRVPAAKLDGTLVRVEQGVLSGTILPSVVDGSEYFGFMGIPYAASPMGELRFKGPKPPLPWSGVRDALSEGSSCPQMIPVFGSYSGHEDCLFLNVYTPELPSGGRTALRPVMVFLHGGAFVAGSGDRDRYSADYLVARGVVVVTINYRLGPLGFPGFQAPGVVLNIGLKDQVAALRWVKVNVAAFGGDSNLITLFGQSAGGASVHYHLLSPMSEGLFQRAIVQSGVALNPWAYRDGPSDVVNLMAKELSCNVTEVTEMVTCLRQAPERDLIEAAMSQQPSSERSIRDIVLSFAPMVESAPVEDDDEVFLPDSPLNLTLAGLTQPVPLILGVTSHEGLMVADFLLAPEFATLVYDGLASAVLNNLHYVEESAEAADVMEKVKSFYFGDEPVTEDRLDEFVNITTDVLFANGIDTTVRLLAALTTSPVYYYEFSYGSNFTKQTGVKHGEELMYLFHQSKGKDFKHEDKSPKMIHIMSKMWTNFAKTGNPTSEQDRILQVTWEPVAPSEARYLDIGSHIAMGENPEHYRMEFWENIFEEAQAGPKL